MDNTDKIMVINNSNSRVGVALPDFNFTRTWPAKGAKIPVSKEILEQMVYDEGCRYMFESGILYIEDMGTKKELGLEPEDAIAPVNIIVLTDAQKEKLWKYKPLFEFKEEVKKLSYEEVQNLADYAIKNKTIGDVEKCEFVKSLIGMDIIKAIQLNTELIK